MIKYVVLSVEKIKCKDKEEKEVIKYLITTSCFRDGKAVQIWITESWYQKNNFYPLMPVSLKWNKDYNRFDSVFPYSGKTEDEKGEASSDGN